MAAGNALEGQIRSIAQQIFSLTEGEAPSIFNKDYWSGLVLDWCMKDEAFKVEMFRFVDVFPTLKTSEAIIRHLREYFLRPGQDFPRSITWGIRGGALAAGTMAGTIEKNISAMARRFIAGATAQEALENLRQMRHSSIAFTVDLLGEATVSEAEAEVYQKRYLELLDTLTREARSWPEVELLDRDAEGPLPKVNVSVKLSSLYSQIDPIDPAGSCEALKARLRPLFQRAMADGAFLYLDMEQSLYKDLTLRVFQEILEEEAFAAYPHWGLVLQTYLRDTEHDLKELLQWARKRRHRITLRLVKGAYWDYETILAEQEGWPCPVFHHKYETDLAFEAATTLVLEHSRYVRLAVGSHNVRSLAHAIAAARKLGLPDRAYEIQMLYGMAEPIKKALVKLGFRVRDYVPIGELLPGVAYLVRRLLENTSNESFLRQRFVEGASAERLLEPPSAAAAHARETEGAASPPGSSPSPEGSAALAFRNEPRADFAREESRRAMAQALARVHKGMNGAAHPLIIGGKPVWTEQKIASRNPARPEEVVGTVALASQAEADLALEAAGRAFAPWRDTPPERRAAYLFEAAQLMRKRRFELAALEVYEAGKTWREADADVTEAIDFLDYYGQEMLRLGVPRRLGRLPGELNHYLYEPRGLGVVLAPWNFPLAILTGMASAAVVAGNCVILKPASQTPVIAFKLMEIFEAAKLPPGVMNYLPGPGPEVGGYLVGQPKIDIIAFTGSQEVGLGIIERAGRTLPGQRNVKRVVAEMGGKNAIIVDDDADLDQAVLGTVSSAFGYQGQKCSACSRVIVLPDCYNEFLLRLVEATHSLRVGPPEAPATRVGPVIDEQAFKKISQYLEVGKEEGQLVLQCEAPRGGYFIGPTVFTEIRPEHALAQEEIFGPVLAVMRAEEFEQALEIANGTAYALTGGLFSRSPAHIDRVRQAFRVGNLYINRGITGAMVGRHPFGGSRMSGVGSKAGGSDYLLQFMEPRAICENTMRRGFAPAEE
ncbi:MAG: L-glutamate gamma-semialdehyde dehydrogenase [Candidatus Tectomicrobia bacterium]|uniref:L-glutamate gamma-semialdehyde dehydrogenase n=1 Tax=Tectimicrobiota bacterium TaxID=2528274 RepID=A0A932FZE1_UNCTE|nr:L-glutamate gamma-semialdehyde dehydrogenase [Candidatus Tectomicrobia bacterium]